MYNLYSTSDIILFKITVSQKVFGHFLGAKCWWIMFTVDEMNHIFDYFSGTPM